MPDISHILARISRAGSESELRDILRSTVGDAFDENAADALTSEQRQEVADNARGRLQYIRGGQEDAAAQKKGANIRAMIEGVFGFQPMEHAEITGKSIPGKKRKSGRPGPSTVDRSVTNSILTVPSRSDIARYEREQSDSFLPGAKAFHEQYVAPRLGGEYYTSAGRLEGASQLAEQYGAVPDDVAREALAAALKDAAASGALSPGEIKGHAGKRIAPTVLSDILASHPEVKAREEAQAKARRDADAKARAEVRKQVEARKRIAEKQNLVTPDALPPFNPSDNLLETASAEGETPTAPEPAIEPSILDHRGRQAERDAPKTVPSRPEGAWLPEVAGRDDWKAWEAYKTELREERRRKKEDEYTQYRPSEHPYERGQSLASPRGGMFTVDAYDPNTRMVSYHHNDYVNGHNTSYTRHADEVERSLSLVSGGIPVDLPPDELKAWKDAHRIAPSEQAATPEPAAESPLGDGAKRKAEKQAQLKAELAAKAQAEEAAIKAQQDAEREAQRQADEAAAKAAEEAQSRAAVNADPAYQAKKAAEERRERRRAKALKDAQGIEQKEAQKADDLAGRRQAAEFLASAPPEAFDPNKPVFASPDAPRRGYSTSSGDADVDAAEQAANRLAPTTQSGTSGSAPPPPDNGNRRKKASGGGDDEGPTRHEINEAHKQELLATGRGHLYDSHQSQEELVGKYSAHGLDTTDDYIKLAELREKSDATGEANVKDAQVQSDRKKKQEEQELKDAQRTLDQAKRQREAKEAADAKAAEANLPYNVMQAKRDEIRKNLRNEWAADPNKAKMLGGERHKKEEQKRFKDVGVGTDEDHKNAGKIDLYKLSLLGAGLLASARAGLGIGNIAGSIAQGMAQAVQGAAGGIIAAGAGALDLFLSPFGKSGQFASRLAGSIGQAFASAVGLVGGLGASLIKLFASINGAKAGVAMGLGGAVIGGIVGSAIPGAGTLAGAAGGAVIAGSVASFMTTILSGIGGAFGQALGAIGRAFGELGKSVGDALGSIKGVVSDLVETGKRFAEATFNIQRSSGMNGVASSQFASFANLLTGNPGGLNSYFSNMGMMTPYVGPLSQAWGIHGVNPQDALSKVTAGYGAWQNIGNMPGGMGAVMQRMMLQSQFGGAADQIGNLYSSGGDMVNLAVKTARATAMTPQEAKNDLRLSMDLNVIQSQLDRVKTKFLTDLMPAIQMGLSVFTKLFSANEGKIFTGLATFGNWLVTKFPTYLEVAINAIFDFGKNIAAALPGIAKMGASVYTTFAVMVNQVKGVLGFFLGSIGAALTPFGGLGKPIRSAASLLQSTPDLDPHALDSPMKSLGSLGPGAFLAIANAQDETNTFLNKTLGTHTRDLGFAANMVGREPTPLQSLTRAAAGGLGGASGSSTSAFSQIAAEIARGMKEGFADNPIKIQATVKQEKNEDALYNYGMEISTQAAEMYVRSMQAIS